MRLGTPRQRFTELSLEEIEVKLGEAVALLAQARQLLAATGDGHVPPIRTLAQHEA